MTSASAPLFHDMAGVPAGGAAFWATTSDDVRIRVGIWRPPGPAKGTFLIFPGRTEYIEKYGDSAREMAARGYATLAVDWRGQGLADRLLDDVRIGHVAHYPDYQLDVAAALGVAEDQDLPRPFHVLGHSMGGAIGLRAVMQGLPVNSCAFTAPMWGVFMTPLVRPFALALTRIAPMIGLGTHLPPNMSLNNYVVHQPFKNNKLTTDPDMYRMMQQQAQAHPELGIGGPSLIWLREALDECKYLATQPSPDIPCLTFLGSREQIVDRKAVHHRMGIWPKGELDLVDGAEHEVLMEIPQTRAHVYDRLDRLFSDTA